MPFACIHVPNFLLQAVVRVEPALRREAVGIIDGTPPLVAVIARNKKAASLGLRVGMSKTQAEEIPGVQLRRRSPAQETAAHAALVDLALSFSPQIEETAADSIGLDLEGLLALFGSLENLAQQLAARAKKFGLHAQVAVASNPEAAQLAARGFPGVTVLAPDEESERLGQLPVAALNLSEEMKETLERWGVRTCRALAALPTAQLSERLGQEGVLLQELARGASRRALIPAAATTRFEEAMELDTSVSELEPLSFLLARLLGQLCERLAARALATNEIRLKMQLDPSEEEIFGVLEHARGRRKAPKQKNSEHFEDTAREKDSGEHNAGDVSNRCESSAEYSSKRGSRSDGSETRPSVYEHTLRLPLPMRDPKALLRLWRLHLEANPPASPIVKIEMAAEPAKTRFAQTGLFTPLSPDPEKLEITMARTQHLVGDGNIGAPEPVDTHRPFAFRVNHFDPGDPNAPVKKQRNVPAAASDWAPNSAMDSAVCPPTSTGLLPATALRVFRPAIPVKIEIGEEAPARVFFGGAWGNVIAASGPWRTSGDWWSSDPWNEDEWDLEIAFPMPAEKEPKFSLHKVERAISRGVYRAIRERASGNWFIRGVYD